MYRIFWCVFLFYFFMEIAMHACIRKHAHTCTHCTHAHTRAHMTYANSFTEKQNNIPENIAVKLCFGYPMETDKVLRSLCNNLVAILIVLEYWGKVALPCVCLLSCGFFIYTMVWLPLRKHICGLFIYTMVWLPLRKHICGLFIYLSIQWYGFL